jgi:hypothetical protein
LSSESELENRASKTLKRCEPGELIPKPRVTAVRGSESAAWIGGKIGLSESEGFSGLCIGRRNDAAQAAANREVI